MLNKRIKRMKMKTFEFDTKQYFAKATFHYNMQT